ncbi:creatininase, partial [Streptomyces sp. WAC 04229]|uniref:creatininase family protein n=1 Tax=Streptomyces sp. WAC 04229 TaxID=2203206 RepID=UPI001002E4A4
MSQSRLTELTWREVRRAGERGIALLPIGSQEQHAGHLPMGTDTLLVEEVVDRALALLSREAAAPEVVRLPALPFGHSPHHLFAAAVSLSAATLGAVLDDVLDSLVTSGHHRVMVVNGHGGNDEIMRLAVKRFALRARVTVAACSYWTLTAGEDGAGRPDVTPGHAGWFETSLMLAAHPRLVRTPVPAPSSP